MNAGAGWLVPAWSSGRIGALMSTRDGGVSCEPFASMNVGLAVGDDVDDVARNRSLFAEACGGVPVYLRQVHGNRVVRVGASDAGRDSVVHQADALFTTEPGVACTIQAADCLPVLLAAPDGSAVAAAHAGWRGLAAGVIEAAVARVGDAAGCAPERIEAWLGACIGPRAFEVGADVLQAFGVDPSAAPGCSSRFALSKPGKWLADLPGLARDRLERAGVRRIGGGSWCSVEDPSRFFSFRRDGATGRMAAAIWITRP